MRIWETVLTTGQTFGENSYGLGRHDTLRTEVCSPHYSREKWNFAPPSLRQLQRRVRSGSA